MNKLRQARPYQTALLKKIENRYRVPLFWRMRIGKSMPIIRWIQSWERKLGQKLRVLIVCPKSPIVSWMEELELENQPFQLFTTKNKDIHHWLLQPVWALTNYECLTAKDVYLHNLPWDAILLDESTKIKGNNTNITKLITDPHSFPTSAIDNTYKTKYTSTLKHQLRAVLTGSPDPESYLDYFHQFKFLYGKWFKYANFYEFKYEFFQLSPEKWSNKYIPKPMVSIKIANFLKTNAFILGHKEAGIDLPNVYQKRYVELSTENRKIYNEYEENWYSEHLNAIIKAYDPSSLSKRSPVQLMTEFAFVAQNYLHQIACGYPKQVPGFSAPHKLNELLFLSSSELKKEKIVIWCRYNREIEEIYKALKNKANRKPATITGKDNQARLKSKLDAFRLPNKDNYSVDILVCQVKKAGMGMDLSASDTQIFFSRSWSGLENIQCADRIIHPLKMDKPGFQSLLTIDIVTKDTVDEDLIKVLIEKKSQTELLKLFMSRMNYGKLKSKELSESL